MENKVRTGIGTFITVFGGLIIIVTLVVGSRWYIDQRVAEEAKSLKSQEKSHESEVISESSESSPSAEHQDFGLEDQ